MKVLNKKQCCNFVKLAIKEISKYVENNKLQGFSLGISGGIDSAVVGVIGLMTIEELRKRKYSANYEYMFLDIDSDQFDYEKAKKLASEFYFRLKYINLTDWFNVSPLRKFIPKSNPKASVALGNIKCRLRMISIYNSSILNGHIYLDTDDLSEYWMGFWTRHGDEGDLKFIQEITKTEMYDLGEYLGIPQIILDSKPGDGLKITKSNLAEDQLGLDYLFIDYIMSRFIGEGFDHCGSWDQIKKKKFRNLQVKVAKEINQPQQKVNAILSQALRTSYKRRYGESVCQLLPKRNRISFPEVGTLEFNQIYLKAIRSQI